MKKWMVLICIATLFGGLVSCGSAEDPASVSSDSLQTGDGPSVSDSVPVSTRQSTDTVGETKEDSTEYDTPHIPDPAGLTYDKKTPVSLSVDPESHEPLFLWKSRAYIPYWNGKLSGVDEPHLIPYLIGDGRPRGCVIVCPGGAYGYRESKHEGSNVAEFINSNWNMNAFVLEYRVKPADYRGIVCDVLRAVRFVRFYADDLGVDPERITVMGFSAGGHLACMAAEMFDYGKAGDAIDHISSRPDAAILCYPVISLSAEWRHDATRINFLGTFSDDDALAETFSGENAIRDDMPPVFVFHSRKDSGVDYRNSEALALEMTKQGLSCTFKLYEDGDHGCSLALGWGGDISQWTADCLAWLREIRIK